MEKIARCLARRACGLAAWTAAGVALAGALAPLTAQAQAVVMAGSLGNFDVLNNTGEPAHGFEIQMDGIQAADLTRIFGYWPAYGGNVIRYGAGTAINYAGGVVVRWASPWDAASRTFTHATPVPVNRASVPGESCWTIGMPTGYATAGCEHFGISSLRNPTRTVYRWLVADPTRPGNLIASPAPVSLPLPVWNVVQPAQPALAPVVVAQIDLPAPAVPPPPAHFGDAKWVKVFKTENAHPVDLNELVGDNHAVVPQDAAHLEVSWSLMQRDPAAGGQKRRGRQVNQGHLGNGNQAVVRRYEHYHYAGVYDPLTHEALCADTTCTAPRPGELGDAIGAQNVAANLVATTLAVTVTGKGGVSSSDGAVKCPNACSGTYNPGTSVTLTAKPASGSSFARWGGGCGGAVPTCTLPVHGSTRVEATFVVASPTPVPAPGGGGGSAGSGGGGGGGGGKVVKP